VAFFRVANMDGRQRDGCGGVAAGGFAEDTFFCRGGNLPLYGRGLLDVGDGPDVIGGNQRTKPGDRLFEHGGFADDVEQLLGRLRTAARPEARAAASG